MIGLGYRPDLGHPSYPEIARELAGSGRYGIVCYGHDHQAHDERVNGCLLLNPGELMGRFGISTYALLDPGTGAVERCRVPGPVGGIAPP